MTTQNAAAVLLILLLLTVLLPLARRRGRAPMRAPGGDYPGLQGLPADLRLRRLRVPRALCQLAGALCASVLLLIAAVSRDGPPGLLLPAGLLLAALCWRVADLTRWELRYDSLGLSAPAPAGGSCGYLWRDLVGFSEEDPAAFWLHFADGRALRVPRQIEGGQELRQIALYWVESLKGSATHARTSRS